MRSPERSIATAGGLVGRQVGIELAVRQIRPAWIDDACGVALALGRAEAQRSTRRQGADGSPYRSGCRRGSGSVPFWVRRDGRTALVPITATLTGPVTGGRRGRPFSLPLTDLASVGYVAEEFFLDGTAAAYEAAPGAELTGDGRWRVRPSRTAPVSYAGVGGAASGRGTVQRCRARQLAERQRRLRTRHRRLRI